MTFETKHVDSEHFSFYTCELFLFTSRWKKKPYAGNSELCKLLNPNKKWTFLGYNFCNIIYHTKRDILTLQLEITYTPAVVEENIEYECQKSSSSDQGIETCLNTSDPENVHLSTLNYLQASDDADKPFVTQENSSAYEENCFDASSMGHVLSTSLKQDLTTLHGDQLFCDTKLQTDTETFPAHRCVLSARSPVFKKMFTTDMKEKAGESINIPDISSDTIRRMLQFLYTDCTGVLDLQSAKDLYIASDKYDIATLKQRCSFFMKKNLCSSNVCEILVLADMHQDKDCDISYYYYFTLIKFCFENYFLFFKI
ncbi:unnamed protein product [Larinioides sclopetarius]|uniref:BTB domain-containing protein n=1 Tax=Larinioides sclopetarius TaxID=280406 RepID=A0AAV2BR05_9ARAC